MGAAFSEGMADYLIEQGVEVEWIVHFEPYQAKSIKSNGERPDVLAIDFQDDSDYVIKFISPGEMPGADIHVPYKSKTGIFDSHSYSINNDNVWDIILEKINDN